MTKTIYKKQKQIESIKFSIDQLTLLLKKEIQANFNFGSENLESERAIFISGLFFMSFL